MPKPLPETIAPRGLSIDQTAEYLGVCKSIVKRLIRTGVITPIRFPGINRAIIDKRALDATMTALREARS
jgi:excisionase family DNA binding protein